MQAEDQEFGIGLGYYWRIIKRQRWLIVICTLLGLGVGIGATQVVEPRFSATTHLQISPLGEDPVALSQNPANLIDHSSEIALVTSDKVLSRMAEALGEGSAAGIRPYVSTHMAKGTSLIEVTFEDANVERAVAGSAELAKSYLAEREQLIIATVENRLKALDAELDSLPESEQNLRSTLYSQRLETLAVDTNSGNVLIEASVGAAQRHPSMRIFAASGLVLGLLVGVLVGFLRDRRNPKLRDEADLHTMLKAPVLAKFKEFKARLPLPEEVMISLQKVRERILAERPNGKFLITHAGKTDVVHRIELPIALAISLSHVASNVKLIIAGCDDRELIRITRHLALHDDADHPGYLRTHHAPDLRVASFSFVQDNSRPIKVLTPEVVAEYNRPEDFTVLALGSLATHEHWLTATRHADAGIVVVDPSSVTQAQLQEQIDSYGNVNTKCVGAVIVKKFITEAKN